MNVLDFHGRILNVGDRVRYMYPRLLDNDLLDCVITKLRPNKDPRRKELTCRTSIGKEVYFQCGEVEKIG